MADAFMKNYACHRKFGKSPSLPNYARVIAHVRDTYCFKGESGNYKFSTKEVLSGRFNGAGTWTKAVQSGFFVLFCSFLTPILSTTINIKCCSGLNPSISILFTLAT